MPCRKRLDSLARIGLVSAVSAMRIDDSLHMLYYNSKYQMLICSIHGCVIRNLRSHLQDEHDLISREHKALLQQYDKWRRISPTEMQCFVDERPVIEHLTLHLDGFRCRECGYATTNRKSIRMHCNRRHQWKISKQQSECWDEVQMQIFFKKQLSRYFVVNEDSIRPVGQNEGGNDDVSENDVQLLEKITKRWQERKQVQRREQDTLASALRSTTRRTGYDERAGQINFEKRTSRGSIAAASCSIATRSNLNDWEVCRIRCSNVASRVCGVCH